MAYWLFKSEPATWSWDQQVAAGEAGTHWNGVRNHLAKKQLMAMQIGEEGFFYHSNEGKAVVGIVAVIRAYYPDHTDETGRFGMVDVRAVRALPSAAAERSCQASPAGSPGESPAWLVGAGYENPVGGSVTTVG